MPRRRVTLQWIASDSARRAAFRRRRRGLLKKAAELATLCDVEVAVVVYGGNGGEEPVVWPSVDGARNVLERFMATPEGQQRRKTMNQEDFLRAGIAKLQEQLRRQDRERRELETTLLMHDAITGRRPGLAGVGSEDLARLAFVVEMRLQAVTARIQHLICSGQLPPPPLLLPPPTSPLPLPPLPPLPLPLLLPPWRPSPPPPPLLLPSPPPQLLLTSPPPLLPASPSPQPLLLPSPPPLLPASPSPQPLLLPSPPPPLLPTSPSPPLPPLPLSDWDAAATHAPMDVGMAAPAPRHSQLMEVVDAIRGDGGEGDAEEEMMRLCLGAGVQWPPWPPASGGPSTYY